MPNRSTTKNHRPERTCIICRKKDYKSELVRLFINEGDIIIDWRKRYGLRGFYSCNDNSCLQLLERWQTKKYSRSKRKERKSSGLTLEC